MAHTKKTVAYNGNVAGQANTYSYSGSFDVFKGTEVVALLDNVVLTYKTAIDNESASPRQYTVDTVAKTIHIGGADLSSGTIIIRPETDLGTPTPRAEFTPGASITSADLNNNQTQLLRRAMEYEETVLFTTGGTMTGDLTMGEDQTIIFEGATDDAHETTLTVADPTADRTITLPNVTGTVVTTGDTATITATMMGPNSVDSSELVDGSVDLSHMSANSVNSNNIVNGSIVNGDIASGANIEFTKLEDLDSAKILVGNGSNKAAEVSVSGDVTIANTGAVTIANDAVEQAMIADDAVGADQLASNAVVNASVASGAAIAHSKLANVTDGQILVGNGSNVPTAVAVSGDVTLANTGAVTIANDAVEQAMIGDDAVGADQLASNAVVNASVASGAAIDHAKLAAVSSGNILVGNGSNQAASVAMSGDVAIAAGGATTIQANSVEIGMIGCEQTSLTNSDSHIPTSGAVVDYVTDALTSAGSFEVIADEDNFPATHPDPKASASVAGIAGMVVSIQNAGGISINSSGVATNARKAGSGSDDITINGFPSSMRGGVGGNADPYVLTDETGLLVTTTAQTDNAYASGAVYDFHRVAVKPADYVQLSDDINDFNSRYRVAADASGVRTGQCGSNGAGSGNYPCDGDMCWFTGSSKMYVFDAPAASTSNSDLDAAWKEVSSVGDYKILTIKDHDQAVGGSGPTFNDSNEEYDLFDGSSDASITSAAQLIVVLNGVIQKPNSGTFSGSAEGFYLNDTHGIKFCDPPPANSSLFVTQIGAATALQVPATNSITNVMIQDGAIDNAAIAANAAIAPSKIDAANFGGIGSSGHIEVKNETSVKFFEASGNGSNKVALKAPAALAADYTITLPPDDGDNLQVLQTNGSGVTDWATMTSGVTSDAQSNTVAGDSAGDSFVGTNANHNTLIGKNAGTAIEDGDYNTAVGSGALITCVDGVANTAVGWKALEMCESGGEYNTAVGMAAGEGLTTGDHNVAIGASALDAAVTGSGNVAVGNSSLSTLTGGSNNTAVGYQCLQLATDSSNNTAVGYAASYANTTGTSNVAVGHSALKTNIDGSYNVAVGHYALEDFEADGANEGWNTAVGYEAGKQLTVGENNTAVGYLALGTGVTTGNSNTAIGTMALTDVTSGGNNTAVGRSALANLETGDNNVAIGKGAGENADDISKAILIGFEAGKALDQGTNIAIGDRALSIATGVAARSNIAIGYRAMTDIAGYSNIGIGGDCCGGGATGTGTGAHFNVAVGDNALEDLSSGDNNVAIGCAALEAVGSGGSNTAVGRNAGGDVTTGSNNFFFGSDAGKSASPSGSVTTTNDKLCLGNNSVGDAYVKVDWTVTSDRRDKTDITPFTPGLSWISKLNPVTYRWDNRSDYFVYDDDGNITAKPTPDGSKKGSRLNIGLIAQDEIEVEKEHGYGTTPDNMLVSNVTEEGNYGMQYSKLVPILINAIKELSTKNDALEARIATLEAG